MMPDLLVPGDAAEQRTRAAYSAAAEASLVIARAAAMSLASHAEAAWPAPGAARGVFGWSPAPKTGDAGQARDIGWLVSPAPTTTPGPSGRFAGLRVAVKDVIDVAGLPVRNGTPGGLWRTPERSAAAWRALADAGAACVGKAATHEMAWGVTTPAVPHPSDPDRVPGGSSGGSAACIAAGVSDAALGTDTGGSIRIPAALCGVVGIRPTSGSIDLDGVTPLAPSQDVVGPLAHDVGTCGAVLEELLGRPLAHPLTDRLRVGVLADPGPLDEPTAAAHARAARVLRTAGVDLVPLDAAPLRLAGAVSLLTMLWESAVVHAEAVRADPAGFGGEARALLTLGDRLAPQVGMVDDAREVLRRMTAGMYAGLRLSAVLTPTTMCVAPLRDATTVRLSGRAVPVSTALTRFTAWASATGLPAVSVPVATSGLPVGVQLMAAPHDEAICLALARLLE